MYICMYMCMYVYMYADSLWFLLWWSCPPAPCTTNKQGRERLLPDQTRHLGVWHRGSSNQPPLNAQIHFTPHTAKCTDALHPSHRNPSSHPLLQHVRNLLALHVIQRGVTFSPAGAKWSQGGSGPSPGPSPGWTQRHVGMKSFCRCWGRGSLREWAWQSKAIACLLGLWSRIYTYLYLFI